MQPTAASAATAAPEPRFIKLDDAGLALPESADTWSQVHDTQTHLIWLVAVIKVKNWQQAMDQAAAFSLGGETWRAPTRNELFTLADVERRSPCIDTAFFPNTPSDWFWSSSSVVGWPEDAWGVNFYDGYVNNNHRERAGFVRPVRVARPRQ